MKALFLIFNFILISSAFAQINSNSRGTNQEVNFNSGINVTDRLLVTSTTIGSQPCPIMDQTTIDAITSPATGDCVFNSTSTEYQFYNGTAWASMGGAGGANTSLSNLTSPTAINQDLLPSTNNSFDLGSSSFYFQFTHSLVYQMYNSLWFMSGGTEIGRLAVASGKVQFAAKAGATNGLEILSVNEGGADANPTVPIKISTGNKTNGTGNSGYISLTTGTSAGGARGDITLDTAADNAKLVNQPTGADSLAIATTYYVDNAVAGGGANTSLSNLTSPTAVNQDLRPSATNLNIGVSGAEWLRGFFDAEVSVGNSTADRVRVQEGFNTPSGTVSVGLKADTASNKPLGIFTQDKTSITNSANVLVESGNTVDGTSGNVELRAGVPSGTGIRGDIKLSGKNIKRTAEDSDSRHVLETVFDNITLDPSATNTVISVLTFDSLSYEAAEITYKVSAGPSGFVLGTLRVISDGLSVNLTDTRSELGTSNISFAAQMNGDNVEITYSSGSDGGIMMADVKKFQL